MSATICACIVRVPWPISVLATRMRAPRSVSASEAFDASLTSPPPVNPEPWKNSESPMPRLRAARAPVAPPLEVGPLHRLAQHLSALQSRAKPLAGGGRVARTERVRSRARAPDRGRARSAMRSMCTSTANCVCGAPNPRKAPLGGVLVITARPRMRTWSQRYGPLAWMSAARQHDGAERRVGAAVEHARRCPSRSAGRRA